MTEAGKKLRLTKGKAGVFMWKQHDTDYVQIKSAIAGITNYQAMIGSKVNILIRKQDIGPAVGSNWCTDKCFCRWAASMSLEEHGLTSTWIRSPYTRHLHGSKVG